ncbi:DHA2 family efflux MFS transporter permease subunit [Gluconacetobacter aggeris]|uniref:DHA2 family efflux MFS transporter permease subunit n=1 Tax=Gluconacetobacter aggeris TaxID=1286186 RepID=A0A7W4P014_9PROT|nr:DHA2 family efflux MFS transporter permease subunit [Gluconacetobacter aggeris]MBB2169215.1 DHA2 family efflux MFS transporter permease subunit [Gluconacetobacter aggeris]
MSETTNVDKGTWRPAANPWLIAVTVTLAAFMEILDGTIINVALPHISGALGSSYDDATWALTSYLVANGIVLTISAWFGKLFGRKRYFMICIIMFTVCSFLCGLSTSLPMLIVFRLMQGFFGGGLQPNQQSIILDTFPPDKRGAAFGLTAIATIIGPIMGPLLGGYLVDNFSWRWIFYVNVPFGILATIGVALLVEDPPWERPARQPVDIIGIALISLGLGGLEIMCDRGEDDDWFASPFVTTMAVCGVAGTIGAVLWLRKARHPLVNLDIFKDRARNYVGSLSISLATATIIQTQQRQQAALVDRMSPFRPEYQHYLATAKQAALDVGMPSALATRYALYRFYRTFTTQVSILAYNEVFMLIGLLAFCIVPLCFLLSPDRNRPDSRPSATH